MTETPTASRRWLVPFLAGALASLLLLAVVFIAQSGGWQPTTTPPPSATMAPASTATASPTASPTGAVTDTPLPPTSTTAPPPPPPPPRPTTLTPSPAPTTPVAAGGYVAPQEMVVRMMPGCDCSNMAQGKQKIRAVWRWPGTLAADERFDIKVVGLEGAWSDGRECPGFNPGPEEWCWERDYALPCNTVVNWTISVRVIRTTDRTPLSPLSPQGGVTSLACSASAER